MNGDGGAPPQVIRRSDGSFHILNMDVESLSPVQRIAVGVQVWPQVRAMLEAAGEFRERKGNPINPAVTSIGRMRDIDRHVANALGVPRTTFEQLRPKLLGNQELLERFANDEFDHMTDAMRAAGLKLKMTIAEGRKSKSKHRDAYFGHGDKFHYAIEPILQYARVWQRRDFRYPHINPKEAKRRLKKLDELKEHLAAIRADIEPRSHVATLRLPNEDRRRKR